ncbi:uncharacterized protein LOC142163197 [Nicotiana tabacum]|uniref:Uncharacterized protein LOC142163197 n=1 Tax=Nicotiana tabacum TaxID=4097 RepID=A0AC58RV03_TOBAC
MALEKRTIDRHENFKETQVEKSMKETRLVIPEKRKIHISEASSVKRKEVEASKSSDKVEEKVIQRIFVPLENNDTDMYMYSDGIKLFVKKQSIFAPHISVYTNTDIVSELKRTLLQSNTNNWLEGTPNNVFAIHVNGTSLHFILREFALVTGLKCVGNDADFNFSEKVPNWLIETYFGGANLVKKKHLMKCFADKNWGPDNDGDSLKITLLYFIHTFIFSSDKNNTTIPRLHFDLVESGCYSEYHWGLKAYETMTKSISKKMDAQKKYYRIIGMPLAMQVWFYECCSDVDPKIALQFDNLVPRILNWRTTGNQPNFAYLMNNMFNDKANMKYTAAYTCIQMHIDVAYICIQDTAYICIQMHTAVYTCIQMHTDVAYICIHDTAYICIQMHTIGYSCIQMHTDAAYTCIQMLHTGYCIHLHSDAYNNCLQGHPSNRYRACRYSVPPLGVYVENSPTPAHSDKPGEDSDDFSPTPDLQCKKKHVTSVGPSSSPPYKKRKEHKRHPSNTEYQSKIPPVCVSEFGQNVLHHNQLADSKNDEVSSLRKDLNSFKEYVVGEFKSLRTLINDNFKMLSDHLQHNQQNKSLHQRKEPIGRRDDGIDTGVGDNVENIDVIFYYLRKKGKYNQTNNFKYTTVDCIFKTRIAKIFDKYADTDSNANVAKEEDVVCEYIRGYRLLANVPWHTVDNVLIPVNLKDKLYWVLAVVSFKERCIKVDSQGVDWSIYSSYTDKSHTDPFEVFFISDLPQQKAGSMDCGVHVTAYAEFLSTLGEIPQTIFDSNLLRQRYGALLLDYAMRKIDVDSISENEAPSNIARQIT